MLGRSFVSASVHVSPSGEVIDHVAAVIVRQQGIDQDHLVRLGELGHGIARGLVRGPDLDRRCPAIRSGSGGASRSPGRVAPTVTSTAGPAPRRPRMLPSGRITVTCASGVVNTVVSIPPGPSSATTLPGVGSDVLRGELGRRIHPPVRRRRREPVEDRPARRRREVARPRGARDVDRYDHRAEDERAPAIGHGAGPAAGSGRSRTAGATRSAARPARPIARSRWPPRGSGPRPPSPARRTASPLPFGSDPAVKRRRRSAAAATAAGVVRVGGGQDVVQERPRAREPGERGRAHRPRASARRTPPPRGRAAPRPRASGPGVSSDDRVRLVRREQAHRVRAEPLAERRHAVARGRADRRQRGPGRRERPRAASRRRPPGTRTRTARRGRPRRAAARGRGMSAVRGSYGNAPASE